MAHVMKHTKASCGHMFAHFDRRAEHISNEKLDRARTHLNYNLATHQQMDQGDFVRKRCSEVRCQNRKDVNVMASWVVTVPKDLPEREHGKFFEATYDFLKNRYGIENVVSAYVHMDEVTPHMHFAFVPVKHGFKEDKKNPRISTEYRKVSAKDVLNRYELQSFHPALQSYLERALGHEVGILNEATKEGNRSIEELKRQTAAERLREANAEASKIVSKAQESVKAIEHGLNALKGKREALEASLEGEIKALEGRQLQMREVLAMHPEYEMGLFGSVKGIKGVTVSDIESLKATAIKGLEASGKLERLSRENEQLNRLVPTMQKRMQMAKDMARLEELEKAFQRLPEHTQRQLFASKEKRRDLERDR